MEVAGQLHVPVALPSGKEQSVPTEKEAVWTPSGIGLVFDVTKHARAQNGLQEVSQCLLVPNTAFLHECCPHRDAISYYLRAITRSATFSQPARTMIQETVCKAIPGSRPNEVAHVLQNTNITSRHARLQALAAVIRQL